MAGRAATTQNQHAVPCVITRRKLLHSVAAVVAAQEPAPGPAQIIFRRVNELRSLRGAQALRWSKPLAACALSQSERKVDLRFRGHLDPERGDVAARLYAAGIRWRTCAENLFEMNGYEDIANFAIVFWWYSLGHQRNMLGEAYTETGIGIARAQDGLWCATQIFI